MPIITGGCLYPPLSLSVNQKIKVKNVKEIFFIIDDTITQVSGKLVESASNVYEHSSGKSVLGFQKLVLGIFNGSMNKKKSHREQELEEKIARMRNTIVEITEENIE